MKVTPGMLMKTKERGFSCQVPWCSDLDRVFGTEEVVAFIRLNFRAGEAGKKWRGADVRPSRDQET